MIQPLQPRFDSQIRQGCAVVSVVWYLHGWKSRWVLREPVLDLRVKDAVKPKSLMLLHVAKLIAELELGIVVLVEVLVLRVDVDVRFVVLFLLRDEELARALVFKGLHLIYSLTEIDDAGASEELDVGIDLLDALHKTESSISSCLDIVDEHELLVVWARIHLSSPIGVIAVARARVEYAVLRAGLYLVSEITALPSDRNQLVKSLFYSLLEIAIVQISGVSVILFYPVPNKV
jgi:hypothetical protein